MPGPPRLRRKPSLLRTRHTWFSPSAAFSWASQQHFHRNRAALSAAAGPTFSRNGWSGAIGLLRGSFAAAAPSRRRPDMLERFVDPATVEAEIEHVRSNRSQRCWRNA